MNILNNYEEHILNLITESVKRDEMVLVLSDKLSDVLSSIRHTIAKRLLSISYDPYFTYKSKITLLDINNKKDSNGNDVLDSISFVSSNKAIELVAKELNIETKIGEDISELDYLKIVKKISSYNFNNIKNTSETSLGRIINKLFPDEYDPHKDIEPFVNEFKSLRDTSMFEIIKGNDIIHWYNFHQYSNISQGTLSSSCMKYEHCKEYLTFYSENEDKVSLLILKDKTDNTKIRGRALLWELSSPSNRIFMDRIYYTNDYIIQLFKDYAINNGWLYKKEQNMDETEDIIDKQNNTIINDIIVRGMDDTGYGHYPYMDTLKYFNGYELSNNGNLIEVTNNMVQLTDTGGGVHQEEDDDDYYWEDSWDDEYDNEEE